MSYGSTNSNQRSDGAVAMNTIASPSSTNNLCGTGSSSSCASHAPSSPSSPSSSQHLTTAVPNNGGSKNTRATANGTTIHTHHQLTKWDKFHSFMDRQCKWIVSSVVFCICLANTYADARTVVVPYFVLSALATAMAGKGVKRLLKQPRPLGSHKEDHGMPSSHGVSLGFLSTTVCVAAFVHHYVSKSVAPLAGTTSGGSSGASSDGSSNSSGGGGGSSGLVLTAQCLAAMASGVYFVLLRVRQGHHTVQQVVVGYCFGSSCCILAALVNYAGWSPEGAQMGTSSFMGGRVDDARYFSPASRIYLNAMFIAGALTFSFRYVRKWVGERGSSLAKKPVQKELFSPTAANPSFLNLQPTAEERDERK